jgi:hypothetical protein
MTAGRFDGEENKRQPFEHMSRRNLMQNEEIRSEHIVHQPFRRDFSPSNSFLFV